MSDNTYKLELLKNIANIQISNVDKNIIDNEINIKLCNYTDVYNSWAITKYKSKFFMHATATKTEIEKFILKKGMVALTKDSEQRDDIGISTYIADDFNDVILGYHNALIKPMHNKLNGSFLNAYLHTSFVKKYFSYNASGSGQRYTLSPNRISKLKIYLPDIKLQNSIGKLFSSIDKKIEINNQINSELEQMAKTLYNYWFVQFDFPDENGRPYKSSGGKMVWNEELKKEIPEGWEVENLANNSLSAIIPVGIEYFNKKNYLETKNINNELISDGAWISYDNRENRANMQPELNSIWFAKMKKSIKHITLPSNSKWFIDKYILSTGFFGIKCIYDAFSYIHCFINSDYFEAKKNILAHGATQKAVNNQDLERIPLIIPPTNLLKAFNSKIYNLLEMKLNIIKTNQELTSLRDFLLPLLMNGQAVI